MSHVAVRAVFHRLNDAWMNGPVDEIPARIGPCFHADAVTCGGPHYKPVAQGRDVNARAFQDFVKMAKVESCTFILHRVGDAWQAVWRTLVTRPA